MENTFTVGQTVRSIWLGDEGVVTGDDDGMIVVMYGKNRVLHFANEIEAIAPVNNGAASLKDFDEPESLTDLGAIDLQAELETLQAKFDTVETLLHEANLELQAVKAERDAAVKALEDVEGVIENALSDAALGDMRDTQPTLLRRIRNVCTRMETARKLVVKALDSIKSQSND